MVQINFYDNKDKKLISTIHVDDETVKWHMKLIDNILIYHISYKLICGDVRSTRYVSRIIFNDLIGIYILDEKM